MSSITGEESAMSSITAGQRSLAAASLTESLGACSCGGLRSLSHGEIELEEPSGSNPTRRAGGSARRSSRE